ncbi:MAG: hypothetical protein JWN04_1186 [Myxococcaceae bacterium]|nr:hypothetical protein [Myxococcaceae bacterium]
MLRKAEPLREQVQLRSPRWLAAVAVKRSVRGLASAICASRIEKHRGANHFSTIPSAEAQQPTTRPRRREG